eukprot:SAG11_NODE_5496_length_1544_cov_1.144637_1_plen_150_part_00
MSLLVHRMVLCAVRRQVVADAAAAMPDDAALQANAAFAWSTLAARGLAAAASVVDAGAPQTLVAALRRHSAAAQQAGGEQAGGEQAGGAAKAAVLNVAMAIDQIIFSGGPAARRAVQHAGAPEALALALAQPAFAREAVLDDLLEALKQ